MEYVKEKRWDNCNEENKTLYKVIIKRKTYVWLYKIKKKNQRILYYKVDTDRNMKVKLLITTNKRISLLPMMHSM